MGKTFRRKKEELVEREEQEVKATINEGRGIDDPMPRTEHLTDRAIRYLPYDTPSDGKDYGRRNAKRSHNRRRRQMGRAICKEWQMDEED